jgi:predicted transcriptional regulator of viral defense system
MTKVKVGVDRTMTEELDKLAEVAKYQKGYIATYQLDVSGQLLRHHEQANRLERVMRGIYRLTHFPAEEDEQLVVAYLWSKEQGTISHESALSVHDLSDALPTKIHLTLPEDQRRVRRKTPEWLELHFADIPDDDKDWYDVVPVTRPDRTLVDVAIDRIELDLLRQAVEEAKERRMVDADFEWELIARFQKRCC